MSNGFTKEELVTLIDKLNKFLSEMEDKENHCSCEHCDCGSCQQDKIKSLYGVPSASTDVHEDFKQEISFDSNFHLEEDEDFWYNELHINEGFEFNTLHFDTIKDLKAYVLQLIETIKDLHDDNNIPANLCGWFTFKNGKRSVLLLLRKCDKSENNEFIGNVVVLDENNKIHRAVTTYQVELLNITAEKFFTIINNLDSIEF